MILYKKKEVPCAKWGEWNLSFVGLRGILQQAGSFSHKNLNVSYNANRALKIIFVQDSFSA